MDAVLRERGLKRNVTITVGHFLMAPFLVDTSDLVTTEPRRLFGPLVGRLPLQIFPPPIDIPPFRVFRPGTLATTPIRGTNGCGGF